MSDLPIPTRLVCPACGRSVLLFNAVSESARCADCKCPHNAPPEEVERYASEWEIEKAAREQEEKASIDREREQRRKAALEEWLSSCPARYSSASLKEVHPETVEKILESLEGGKWPYLFGGLGTGKTFAACATARDCAEHGMRVEMATVPNLLGSIRGAMDNDKGNPEHIVERLSKIPLLVLDDLAAEKSSDWVQETLFRIIDTRYAEMRTTVFTSNLPPAKLGNERVRSRLVECATAIALPKTRPERGGK